MPFVGNVSASIRLGPLTTNRAAYSALLASCVSSRDPDNALQRPAHPRVVMRPFLFATLLCTFATFVDAQPKVAPKVDPKAPYAVVDAGGHSATIRGVAFTPDGKGVV